MAKNKNEWEWESLKIEIKDPQGKIHTLNSGDLGDFCLSALFDELTSYVKEKKGVFSHFAGGLGGSADSLDGALGDFTPPGSSGPLGGGSSEAET